MTSREVRRLIFAHYLQELSSLAGIPETEVSEALQALEEAHHLVLYDKNVYSPTPISMVHPFSHF